MKNLSNALILLCMLFGLTSLPQSTHACDRTFAVLDSIVISGPNFVIYETVCMGSGLTGSTRGADSDTRDIAFGFYTPGAVPINILSFGPPFLTGDTTGCSLVAVNAGPQPGAPFGTQGTVGYLDPAYPGFCPAAYLCITSTPTCGNVHTQCTQFVFTVDVMPDSIRIFGVEGAGNPQGGCYPNPDMLIDFTALPVVWGIFEGFQREFGNELKWTTLSETNNDHFNVERSADGMNFEKIGEVEAAGISTSLRKYTFFDSNPNVGMNHYRITQVDQNGASEPSDVILLTYTAPEVLAVTGVSPNPTDGPVAISLLAPEAGEVNVSLFDIQGKVLLREVRTVNAGQAEIDLDMAALPSGIYFARIQSGQHVIERKILRK